MKYIRTSTVKTLRFRTDHLDKHANCDRPAPYESVCLGSTQLPFRLHIVEEPQLQDNNSRTRPAVLAAGTGWKLFDFSGHFFLNFNGVWQEKTW